MTVKFSQIHFRLMMFTLAMLAMPSGVWAADPGLPYQNTSELSSQKAGSLLVYNYFSSSACCALQENTRINLTNTNPSDGVTVHLFFVDGTTCSVADQFICLHPNQTTTFSLSEVDPGTSGYLVVVAVDNESVGYTKGGVPGRPISFNYLIGDEFITLGSGHRTNLGAEAFTVIDGPNGPVDPFYNPNSSSANLVFDGSVGNYNRVPHVVAVSSIPSPSDGLSSSFDTQIILNRIGGTLMGASDPLGTIFGQLYSDAGISASFNFNTSACQFKGGITRTFPRTVPRPNVHIPAGRTGWAKMYPPTTTVGILGAVLINDNNPNSTSPYSGGHNLHVLRLAPSVTYTIPVFPPGC